MNTEAAFRAPWGLSLKITTAFGACILLGIPVLGLYYNPGEEQLAGYEVVWFLCMVVLPVTILAGAALFMIRSYEIASNKLHILRPGWRTEIDLNGLQAAEADPEAMKRSIRTFGNGGLFSFSGKFRNRHLGPYRAFVTNPKLAVVLTFADKVIIVTPDKPDQFIGEIEKARTS